MHADLSWCEYFWGKGSIVFFKFLKGSVTLKTVCTSALERCRMVIGMSFRALSTPGYVGCIVEYRLKQMFFLCHVHLWHVWTNDRSRLLIYINVHILCSFYMFYVWWYKTFNVQLHRSCCSVRFLVILCLYCRFHRYEFRQCDILLFFLFILY